MTPFILGRRRFLAVSGLMAKSITCGATTPSLRTMDVSSFNPTFSTNFIDESKPVFRSGGGPFSTRFERWGGIRTLVPNKELELYVDRYFVPSPSGVDAFGHNDAPSGTGKAAGLNPFRLQDGCLVITAAPTPVDLLPRVGRPYISGLLSTDQSFDQRYGYFEMRARLPGGQGLWPAFWLFGTTQQYRLEIDVVESLGNDTSRIYQTAQPNVARGEGHHVPLKIDFDYTSEMHDYGVLWTPDELVFFVDRTATATMDGRPFRNEVPVFLMANLAVGGSWGGNPDNTTHFPAEMWIAHIKAYQLPGLEHERP